jgi:hypothetical protein
MFVLVKKMLLSQLLDVRQCLHHDIKIPRTPYNIASSMIPFD